MNILLINYEYPPIGAGAANASKYLATELHAQGHDVVVLTTSFGSLEGLANEDGVWVYRVNSRRKHAYQSDMREMTSFVWHAFLHLGIVVNQFKPQAAIVFFSIPCGPLGLWAKIRYKIPYIISLRGGDIPGNDKNLVKIHARIAKIRRLILRKSLSIVANSASAAQMAEKADMMPVVNIPNGVDTKSFRPGNMSLPFLQILFVGRLAPEKNVVGLLEGFSRLIKNLPVMSDFNLIIVGDGPLRETLEKEAVRLEIQSLVQFRGWIAKNELLTLYQESWCMVNPSFNEGMPNAVLEAMACGLPVIASKVAGNTDIVVHRQNGLLFDLENYEALFTSLLEVMMDMNFRAKLSFNARKHMVEKYSWSNTAEQYLKLISGQEKRYS